MKKIFIAILAIIYLITSTGAVLHMHYCMGELADWGLGHNESTTCSKCGMKEEQGSKKNCCREEQKLIKNVTDQKTIQSAFQMTPIIALVIPISFMENPVANCVYTGKTTPGRYGLLRTDDVAVYIRHCVFII